jgi:hypothetical protein
VRYKREAGAICLFEYFFERYVPDRKDASVRLVHVQ